MANYVGGVGGELRPGDIIRVVGGTLTFIEKDVVQQNDCRTVWFIFKDGDVEVSIPAKDLAHYFGGPNGGMK